MISAEREQRMRARARSMLETCRLSMDPEIEAIPAWLEKFRRDAEALAREVLGVPDVYPPPVDPDPTKDLDPENEITTLDLRPEDP